MRVYICFKLSLRDLHVYSYGPNSLNYLRACILASVIWFIYIKVALVLGIIDTLYLCFHSFMICFGTYTIYIYNFIDAILKENQLYFIRI